MIRVPFIFLSKQAIVENGKLTVNDMFDVYYHDPKEAVLKNCTLTIGVFGSKDDDQSGLELRIVGKSIDDFNIKTPFTFTFIKENHIRVYSYGIDSFPVYNNQTIRFEIWKENTLLNTYPLSFIEEKSEDGDADA